MKLTKLFKTQLSLILAVMMVVAFAPTSFAQDSAALGIDKLPVLDDTFTQLGDITPLDFELGYTLVSDYVWRGQVLGNDVSNQMWTTVGFSANDLIGIPLGNFAFTFWANLTNNQPGTNHIESDLVFDYNIDYSEFLELIGSDPESATVDFNFNFGFIHYEFPHLPSTLGDSDTDEYYFGITVDSFLSPSVYVYNDVDMGNGQWWEIGISHDFDLDTITLATFATLGYNNQQWVARNGTSQFTSLIFGASVPFAVGEHSTLEPFLHTHLNLNEATTGGGKLTKNKIYGGFNYIINF